MSRAVDRSWRWRLARDERETLPEGAIVGPGRSDRRTKHLIPRLQAGDVAVIDHEDLDRVAAEELVSCGVAAVVNAASSMTGRYPNMGGIIVTRAGIPLLDDVGSAVLDQISEGDQVALVGDQLYVDGDPLVVGNRQTQEDLTSRLELARQHLGDELERFAENTLEYLHREHSNFLTEPVDFPDVGINFAGRHVLIVVRGNDYQEDLDALRRIGYVKELRPILVGVDGGADALLDIGLRPDMIIGDFDSVSKKALRSGAKLVVHAYESGVAPGAERLDRLGFEYVTWEAAGTSEDIAMLMAYDSHAELIVAVGAHNSMVEFFDKGRAGMSSTFLVRMKVGGILVDAKGVSRLYKNQVRKRDMIALVVSAAFTIAVIGIVSEPIRLVVRNLWLSL
ncbi:MAG: putative cytokinetic ring protein SteA [Acidimicrobiales bacterium]